MPELPDRSVLSMPLSYSTVFPSPSHWGMSPYTFIHSSSLCTQDQAQGYPQGPPHVSPPIPSPQPSTRSLNFKLCQQSPPGLLHRYKFRLNTCAPRIPLPLMHTQPALTAGPCLLRRTPYDPCPHLAAQLSPMTGRAPEWEASSSITLRLSKDEKQANHLYPGWAQNSGK